MTQRHNHYELAFEELLRSARQPYVAVDETRRSLAPDASLKSLDFLVTLPGGQTLLVDIKGRRFPSGSRHPQYWRNWSTADDLRGLAEWARHLGPQAVPVLVYAYLVAGPKSPVPIDQLFWFREQPYGFVAIRLADYLPRARTLSPRWGTVSVPVGDFRERALPWHDLVQEYEQQSTYPLAERSDIWQPLTAQVD